MKNSFSEPYFPWQQSSWDQLTQSVKSDRLAHAILLSGQSGLGKIHFVGSLSKFLLCDEPHENLACGHCQSCLLYEAGTHPDFKEVTPEDEKKNIKIDDVRKLCQQLSLTPQISSRKIAIIFPAENMNLASANSLLKTLEEPTPNTHLFLLAHRAEKLLPTIRSRCQQMKMSLPTQQQAISWLAQQADVKKPEQLLLLSQQSPLTALEFSRQNFISKRLEVLAELQQVQRKQINPCVLAEKWQKIPSMTLLNWLYSFVADMIKIKSTQNNHDLFNADVSENLKAISEQLDLKQLYCHYDNVIEAIKLNDTQINSQMMIENMIVQWVLK
ncbi:MAG: DNA polymerase III subunit delta' [Methylococcales bacterium]|nr:DNA polymerase III subunit delta' [Methylococcales bacterium]